MPVPIGGEDPVGAGILRWERGRVVDRPGSKSEAGCFGFVQRAVSWWKDRRRGGREASTACKKARLFSIFVGEGRRNAEEVN